jgi:hypothetical protein
MSDRRYPSRDAVHLVEHLGAFPPRARPRRWVLRDDNQQHYHGVVRLSEGPAYIDLLWKPSADGPEQQVGRYRLHLSELLAENHVRFEREDEPGDEVRLRFYRGAGGVVFVQARTDRPGLPVGQIRPTGT